LELAVFHNKMLGQNSISPSRGGTRELPICPQKVALTNASCEKALHVETRAQAHYGGDMCSGYLKLLYFCRVGGVCDVSAFRMCNLL
jgi:hypothetical protein